MIYKRGWPALTISNASEFLLELNMTLYIGTWLTHWQNAPLGAPKQTSPLPWHVHFQKICKNNFFFFTSADVKRINLGKPDSPFSLISGQYLYLAKFMAYILDTEPPAKTKAETWIAWRYCPQSASHSGGHGWLWARLSNDKWLSKSREHPPPIPFTSSSPTPEVLVYPLIPEFF